MSATGARNSALTTRMGGTTMNTTATQLPASPSGNPGRPRKSHSRGGRLALLIASTGAALAVSLAGAGAASADVNLQYASTYGIAYMSNCTITVGDQYSPSHYAIGDTTVKCSSNHNIWVYTQLYRNGTLIANSPYPYSYYPDTAYVHDTPTTAIRCGGAATWYTVAWVNIDGTGWKGWYSPSAPFTPSC
jgi:hypothetical protein